MVLPPIFAHNLLNLFLGFLIFHWGIFSWIMLVDAVDFVLI